MVGSEYCRGKVKRSLDIAIASGAIPATSPIWAGMYLYNRIRKQPLLFHQERIGKCGQPFSMVKFETLYSGAETETQHTISLNQAQPDRKSHDPRVPSGIMQLMRSSGLNEIPQIENILKGDMSVVGPRPLPSEFLSQANEIFPSVFEHWRQTALTIKPGLVGTDPLNTRRLPISNFDRIAGADIQYYETASFWIDLSIIANAFIAICRIK